jgi:hypothetical protein
MRARRDRPAVRCRKHRSSCRQVCAEQTYHQDQHPDRTLHGLFSLRAGHLGAETLTGGNYTPTCKYFRVSNLAKAVTSSVMWSCKPELIKFVLIIQCDMSRNITGTKVEVGVSEEAIGDLSLTLTCCSGRRLQ